MVEGLGFSAQGLGLMILGFRGGEMVGSVDRARAPGEGGGELDRNAGRDTCHLRTHMDVTGSWGRVPSSP
jgi:hypothetical protein